MRDFEAADLYVEVGDGVESSCDTSNANVSITTAKATTLCVELCASLPLRRLPACGLEPFFFVPIATQPPVGQPQPKFPCSPMSTGQCPGVAENIYHRKLCARTTRRLRIDFVRNRSHVCCTTCAVPVQRRLAWVNGDRSVVGRHPSQPNLQTHQR